jgi:hypothetical protein
MEILEDPIEYESENVFIVPDQARWDYLRFWEDLKTGKTLGGVEGWGLSILINIY